MRRIASAVKSRIVMCASSSPLKAQSAMCNGETVCTAANDLERDIRLMTVDTDEETNINLVPPDGQIRMVRIDLALRHDLWILRPVIGHGDEVCGPGFGQSLHNFGLAH